MKNKYLIILLFTTVLFYLIFIIEIKNKQINKSLNQSQL